MVGGIVVGRIIGEGLLGGLGMIFGGVEGLMMRRHGSGGVGIVGLVGLVWLRRLAGSVLGRLRG